MVFVVLEDGKSGVSLGFEGGDFAGEGGMDEAEIDVAGGREGGRVREGEGGREGRRFESKEFLDGRKG